MSHYPVLWTPHWLSRSRRPAVEGLELIHVHIKGPGLAVHEEPEGQVAPAQGPLLHVTLSVG